MNTLIKLLIAFVFFGNSVIFPQVIPPNEMSIGIDEKFDQKIDETLVFQTYQNKNVQLSEYLNKKPVIINFAYYSCPMLCHLLADGIVDLVNRSDLVLGRDYSIVTISINPDDTPETSSAFREKYLSQLNKKFNGGWSFLTGDEESIKSLTDQLGFKFKKNEQTGEYAHSAALILLTPEGKVSRYLYGIEFEEFDLKLAVAEASENESIRTIEKVLLFCYNYDPTSRSYVLKAWKIMRIGGVFTLVILIGFIAFIKFRKSNKAE